MHKNCAIKKKEDKTDTAASSSLSGLLFLLSQHTATSLHLTDNTACGQSTFQPLVYGHENNVARKRSEGLVGSRPQCIISSQTRNRRLKKMSDALCIVGSLFGECSVFLALNNSS